MNKDDMNLEEHLYLQLHEQYIKNVYNKTKTIISFLTTIAFVFTAYGYAYSYPYMHKDIPLSTFYDSFMTCITIGAYLILSLLAILAVNLGYCSRKEHIIIHYIYHKVFFHDFSNFLANKHPEEPKSFYEYLPKYYLILFIFFNVFIMALCIASCLFDYSKMGCDNICTIHWILIVCCIIVLTINMGVYYIYFNKYLKRKRESEKRVLLKEHDEWSYKYKMRYL